MKKILKILVWGIVVCVVAFFTFILLKAFEARGHSELKVWHVERLESEFTEKDYSEAFTFDDYLAIEEDVFDEMDEKVTQKLQQNDKDLFNRYFTESLSSPGRFEHDYNRSYELGSENPEGGIVLVHGLTDCPYSLKDVGRIFNEKGFYVISMRLPGHGTIPGALVDVEWEDWFAAVKVACARIREKIGEEKPFYMAGYSNGGTLCLLYALQGLEDESLIEPYRLFLFSPAVGVSKFAALSEWLQVLSFIPYFEKSRWVNITPEYDPFKYNSFPLNASEQTYELSMKTKAEINRNYKNGKLSGLGDIITFQSVVDSTVIIGDLIGRLYARLDSEEDELVLFDVNRVSYLHNFFKTEPDELLDYLGNSKGLGYRLTVVTNEGTSSNVVAKSKEKGEAGFSGQVSLEVQWPEGLYSLSHIAIPIPADDALYGFEQSWADKEHPRLGAMSLRGERRLLMMKADDLMRLRSNPFFDYIVERIVEIVDGDVNTQALGNRH